jgi:hypothetical protein
LLQLEVDPAVIPANAATGGGVGLGTPSLARDE